VNEFSQNNVLDAWTTQQAAQQQNPLLKYRKKRDNVYSGMLSGPVIKNKLFFATSYDGRQTAAESSTNTSVPTMLQRAGDFSKTYNSAGQLDVIYDPLTTRQVGTFVCTRCVPRQSHPSNRINPVARNILALDVPPNYVSPNSPITNVNNYFIGRSFPGLMGQRRLHLEPEEPHVRNLGPFRGELVSQPPGMASCGPTRCFTVNGDPIKRQHQGSIVDHSQC
jgi:hypothetical protein